MPKGLILFAVSIIATGGVAMASDQTFTSDLNYHRINPAIHAVKQEIKHAANLSDKDTFKTKLADLKRQKRVIQTNRRIAYARAHPSYGGYYGDTADSGDGFGAGFLLGGMMNQPSFQSTNVSASPSYSNSSSSSYGSGYNAASYPGRGGVGGYPGPNNSWIGPANPGFCNPSYGLGGY